MNDTIPLTSLTSEELYRRIDRNLNDTKVATELWNTIYGRHFFTRNVPQSAWDRLDSAKELIKFYAEYHSKAERR